MTFQNPPSHFAIGEGDAVIEKLNAGRVQYVEAFVSLEIAVTKIVLLHKPQFDARSPFGSKLKAIAELKSPPLSKKACERFSSFGNEIDTLTKIRNDLVHGIMTITNHEGTQKAAFQNAADRATDLPHFTLLALDDLENGRKRLKQIANEIKQLASPPSQPPPSPGAAGGP